MANKGRAGEAAALAHLQERGYQLLAQNFRCYGEAEPLSEIDLIFLAPDEDAGEAAEEANMDRAANLLKINENEALLNDAPLVLVFVEVKNWNRVPLGDLSLNLTKDRQRRMFRTAECFLQSNPRYAVLKRRFDLFAFQGRAEPLHIKAAFP